MSRAIAVVGMACRYPGANNPQELWENCLAKRQAFRRLPRERLELEDYYQPDAQAGDNFYITQAAVLEGWEFDRVRFRVSGSSFRSADLTHWLALEVADSALADAGFPQGTGLPQETSGVLLGNTLTGEFSRASLMRLRWPYVRRVLSRALLDQGWELDQLATFMAGLEADYKAPFPSLDEESLAGGLSNTIAGRICNHFDLHGGGYTLDGACSSSLLAVSNACTALAAGDLDLALAGGVDLSLDPFELIGFARTSALSRTRMRVYDRRSDGFWPGEGCGMLVLMRHQDALARGLRCYGLIAGWGISSDGSGGITRPEVEGQRLAMKRAYRRSGYGINSVPLFEGHGTGTSLGDTVELRALNLARSGARQRAAIGSIKANIGHTKAAAGAAGLIKTVMALHTQLLPPATGCDQPHAELEREESSLRLLQQGEAWPADQPLRAGVSSFGFGGIDVHLALEGASSTRRSGLTDHDRRLLSTAQDTELFFLNAVDREELEDLTRRLARLARRLSFAELTDLAAHLAHREESGPLRAAVLAATPERLAERLDTLVEWLQQGITQRMDLGQALFLGRAGQPARIGLLFSGQASPVRLQGDAMARRFPAIETLYREADLPQEDNGSTATAQPAIIAAERALLWLLERLGIEACIGLGHSLGEYAALHWAGAFDGPELQYLSRVRGRLMAGVSGPRGAMTAIQADGEQVARLLDDAVVISCFNSPHQTVISGETTAVGRAEERARSSGLRVTRLPVSYAFHSPLMQPAVTELARELNGIALQPLRRAVMSTISCNELAPDTDLSALLQHQMTHTVRFTEAFALLAPQVDFCLEIGPGQVLSGLVEEVTDLPVFPLDGAGHSLAPFLMGVAAAYVSGSPVRRSLLFDDRLTRPSDPKRELRFLVNPCELAPNLNGEQRAYGALPASEPAPPQPVVPTAINERPSDAEQPDLLELLRTLVATKAELPPSAVQDDSRLLVDLHLNSISVGQIVAEAARQSGLPASAAPTDYADATLAAVAEALHEQLATGAAAQPLEEPFPVGVDNWVHAFRLVWQEVRPPVSNGPAPGKWSLFSPSDADPPPALAQAAGSLPGRGALVWLPAGPPEAQLTLLQQAVTHTLDPATLDRFVLVQEGAAAASLARTLHLEHPQLHVCVLDLPDDNKLTQCLVAEVSNSVGYSEVRYDPDGCRLEPFLAPLTSTEVEDTLPLGEQDVLLVSGGGKGIAAECALELALACGVHLALLGRSDPVEDQTLTENLQRFSAHGVVYRYFPTDVTNPQAVQSAVDQCTRELGTITGILHGAGLNRPHLLHELSREHFRATLAPKLDGFDHLLAAVDNEHLRVLITFGSIIARSGMRGEADYAIANEALARRTELFSQAHPQCRCLCLEWSIWSGVGMGERLGRIDALLREGISPISPDQGVQQLRQLLSRTESPVRIVVSGRLGTLPTLRMQRRDLPFRRFLEPATVYYPEIELLLEPELSTGSDPYLSEHALEGTPLFPAVMGLEAMAQAAMALKETECLPCFYQVEFLRPISVAADNVQTLRIAALSRDPDTVEVVLRSADDGFQQDHFRALCRFDDQDGPPDPIEFPESERLVLDPGQDLYQPLLFHSGRFRRITGYRHLTAWSCSAEVTPGDDSPWFATYLPPDLELGDPGSRDAALHAIQACIPHARLLPVGADRIIFGDPRAAGPWVVRAREIGREGDLFHYDMELRARDGILREAWQGLRLRRVGPLTVEQWPPALLCPFLERRMEALSARRISIVLERNAAPERREPADRAMQHALGAPLPILRRSDGRPETTDGNSISASHAGQFTLALAGDGDLACDLEPVTPRTEQQWQDLLGEARLELARVTARNIGEGLDRAATRVWGATECLKKVGAMADTPLLLESAEEDGWAILAAGRWRIATTVIRLRGEASELALALLQEMLHAKL